MVKLKLSSDDVRSCKKPTFLKKGTLDWIYKQGLLYEKSKEPDKFRAGKTRKSVRQVSKSRSGDKL